MRPACALVASFVVSFFVYRWGYADGHSDGLAERQPPAICDCDTLNQSACRAELSAPSLANASEDR